MDWKNGVFLGVVETIVGKLFFGGVSVLFTVLLIFCIMLFGDFTYLQH